MELYLLLISLVINIVLLILFITRFNKKEDTSATEQLLREQFRENREELNRTVNNFRTELSRTLSDALLQIQNTPHQNLQMGHELQKEKIYNPTTSR